jgi:hypothetical protein
MTLIAAFDCDHHSPVFLSDRLLSSESGRPNIKLPTIGKHHERLHLESGGRVYGTAIKTRIINDGLIVAWAGQHDAAQYIIEEITQRGCQIGNDGVTLGQYLEAACPSQLQRVQLIISGRDPRPPYPCTIWSNACKQYITPDMKIWATGSGAARFRQCLEQVCPIPIAAEHCREVKAVIRALSVAGALLGEELGTGGSIAKGFGAGYDVTTFDGAKAFYVTDVCYLFWVVKKTATTAEVGIPFKILKTIDLGDNEQCLYSAEFVPAPTGEVKTENETYDVSSELSGTVQKAAIRRNENLRTRWQVNIFIIHEETAEIKLGIRTSHCPQKENHLVVFDQTGDKSSFSINSEELFLALGISSGPDGVNMQSQHWAGPREGTGK